ncbi:hypothetical protein VTN77DRAFT_6230 [Rasamsonia byssochlamydoides]|uniref:uncharacterized protein n=1 Tax=Rasamsonia byssochlamydoides TaxID=89139 RepID=UPI0037449598
MPFEPGPPLPLANQTQTCLVERASSNNRLLLSCGSDFYPPQHRMLCLKVKLGAARVDKFHFLGMDDVFNFLAVCTFYGLAIAELIAIERGMGAHVEAVLYYKGQEGLDQYNFAIYFCALFYNTVLGMVKLSVLSLYRRILRGVQSTRLTRLNWAVFTLVSMNTTANVLVAAFQCHPIEAAFRSDVKGKCINASASYLGNAITGIITDTMVYLLAVPIIKPLQMDQKRKAVTLLTFLIGTFAVVTSCVRLGFLPALLTDPDTTGQWGSIPAITSLRYFFRKPGEHSSATDPTLNSCSHIKLDDFGDNTTNNKTSITAGGRPWTRQADGGDRRTMSENDSGSEERLVYGGKSSNTISQTTEVEVTYSRMDV